MKTLLILGAGQYGLAAREVAQRMGIFDCIQFLDDQSETAIGTLGQITQTPYDEAFVAIGNSEIRARLLEQIDHVATLIDPAAVVMPSATVGEGSIVEAGSVLCANATIGKGCIVMANAVVGHNASVGALSQLKYNCSIPERSCVPRGTVVNCNEIYAGSCEVK